jgi:hypothetical protein
MRTLLKWFSEQIESYEGSYKKFFSIVFLSYVSGFVICDCCMILDSIGLEPTSQFGGFWYTVFSMTMASAFFGGLFATIVNVPVYVLFFRQFRVLECFLIVFPMTFIFGLLGTVYRRNSGYFILGSLIGLFLGYLFVFLKKVKFFKAA